MPLSWLALALALAPIAGWFVPTRWYLLLPGEAVGVESLVNVEGHLFRPKGSLMLLTVYADPANLDTWAFGRLYPQAKLVPKEQELPRGVNQRQYDRLLTSMMDESQTVAKVVALRRAGYAVDVRADGALVQEALEGSPAQGQLEPGDLIVSVNGSSVSTADDLTRLVRALPPGTLANVGIRREGGLRTVVLRTAPLPDHPEQSRLGVRVTTHQFDYQLPMKIDVRTRDIGGPSAGLMLAIGILDALTGTDSTHGQRVAGTGTIALDGAVGAVGEVELKLRAAEKGGARYLLVPRDNAAALGTVRTAVHVVPVASLDEALRFLDTLPAG